MSKSPYAGQLQERPDRRSRREPGPPAPDGGEPDFREDPPRRVGIDWMRQCLFSPQSRGGAFEPRAGEEPLGILNRRTIPPTFALSSGGSAETGLMRDTWPMRYPPNYRQRSAISGKPRSREPRYSSPARKQNTLAS